MCVVAADGHCDPQLRLTGGVLSLAMQDSVYTTTNFYNLPVWTDWPNTLPAIPDDWYISGYSLYTQYGKVQINAVGDDALEIEDGIMKVPYAAISKRGIVQVGAGLEVSSGVIGLQTATTSLQGIIQVGSGFAVTDGVLSLSAPDATTTSKGIVKVGSGLAVSNGVLSLSAPDATTTSKGVVQIGDHLSVTAGTLHLDTPATTTSVGVIQVGPAFNVDVAGILSWDKILPLATTTTAGGIILGDGLEPSVPGEMSLMNTSKTVFGLASLGPGFSQSSGVNANIASTTVFGTISAGAGIHMTGEVITADYATTTTKGVVSLGDNFDITGHVISVPSATTISKGVVQFGGLLASWGGVPNTNYGVLNVNEAGSGLANESEEGVVTTGTHIINTAGHISVAKATTTSLGTISVADQGLRGFNFTPNLEYGYAMQYNPSFGRYPTPIDATPTLPGIMQPSTGIDISNGTISCNVMNYVPEASATVKGLVQLGDARLSMTGSSLDATIPDATGSTTGIAKADGSTLTITGGVLTFGATMLRTNASTAVANKQVSGTVALTGTSIDWDGSESNIFTATLTGSTTLNNGTNIQPGAYYQFILTTAQTVTYGSQFKFRDGATTQPVGSKSVLSCYAIDASTLYCVMQPNYV